MIYAILGALVLSGITALLFKMWTSERRKRKAEEKKSKELIKSNEKLKHIITAMEVVYREDGEKKKKLHTGNDLDDFNNSLSILSDLSSQADRL